MRMSCNGCRVLRKGCSENCSIRPCLQWISSPEAQANATLFLAKFYGRAGLLNLINAGPEHLRPAVFRSLLYEACGRIVNPIYGSVGLLWSGSWQLCQSAAEAVLKGAPIVQVSSEPPGNTGPPMKAYDIRHVSKEASQELHRVKARYRFKQVAKNKTKSHLQSPPKLASSVPVSNRRCGALSSPDDLAQDPSHESSLSRHSEPNVDSDSAFSAETVEASLVAPAEREPEPAIRDDAELDLGLTLGHGHVASHARPAHATGHVEIKDDVDVPVSNTCNVELCLHPMRL